MRTLAASYAEEFNALRETYARALPRKIGEVEEALEALFASPGDQAVLGRLNSLLHSLMGSSGTLGFAGVSSSAASLRALLSADGGAPSGELRGQAASHVARMKKSARRPEHADAESLPLEPAPSKGGEEGRLIFLVEDDPEQAYPLAAQLSRFGYEVRTFAGVEALKAGLEREKPAAIIMDIILPEGELAGAQGIAALRSLQRLALPVLFLTVRGDLAARIEAVRAGADAYFTKPGDLGALIERLDLLTAKTVPEPYRVLIVEDDPLLAQCYATALKTAGMIPATVSRPLEVMAPLLDLGPDLILLDCNMPGCSGPELAAALRQQEEMVGIPIVFLSSETELERQLAARRAGAEDFLTKPVSRDRLVAEVTLRAERGRVLRSHMARDGQTGLLNHPSLFQQLEREIHRARRRCTPLAFAMIDIDRFKRVNDASGHSAGDRVIRSLSRFLQKRLRKTDVIGRCGGDEFGVALLDTPGPVAARVLGEIQSGFAQIRHASGRQEFRVTFSCGLAAFPDFPDAALLKEAADKALYRAKREGRDRVVLV